jgi:hypothetical protein
VSSSTLSPRITSRYVAACASGHTVCSGAPTRTFFHWRCPPLAQMLIAVYDGHGQHGEYCSEFVAFEVIELLEADMPALTADPKGAMFKQVRCAATTHAADGPAGGPPVLAQPADELSPHARRCRLLRRTIACARSATCPRTSLARRRSCASCGQIASGPRAWATRAP